jgi:alkyl hydroperoxide reductase subunit AhpC
MSNGCPTVKAYQERLKKIQNDYQSKGVQLLGINSNNEHLSAVDSFEEMARRVQEAQLNFPYLKDTDGSVARSYGAICTPHVFLLDKSRKLRYKGRIDDARHESRVTTTDLTNALDDLTNSSDGRPGNVRVVNTVPFGCSIVW